MKFGVQTFTVRRMQKKDIWSAYIPLRKLGVSSLEVARMKFTPKNAMRLAELCSELDIEISAIQVKPKYVFSHPEQIIEFCKTVRCKRVVISMLPFGCILGREKRFYEFVSSLDGAFELYAKEGITLAYHHHNWEYVKLSSGKTRMEELLSGTEKINFVHDTYWTAGCGVSPAEQIKAFGSRLLGIHLRDLTAKAHGIAVKRCDAAIGDGVIDFASVLRAAEEVGCSYYVIEQNTSKPYDEIKKSLKALDQIKSKLL